MAMAQSRRASSVLGAVEGFQIDAPVLAPVIVPITIAILVSLFLVQRGGTDLRAGDAGVVRRDGLGGCRIATAPRRAPTRSHQ